MTGRAATSEVPCQRNTQSGLSKPRDHNPLQKIAVTSRSPVGDVSAVTLIRTDTTLDHSQKAEKVYWLASVCAPTSASCAYILRVAIWIYNAFRLARYRSGPGPERDNLAQTSQDQRKQRAGWPKRPSKGKSTTALRSPTDWSSPDYSS